MNDSYPGRPVRSLGQNFLISPGVAEKIVELVSPSEGDLIFEIGPGRGSLTGLLGRRGVRVVGYELDQRLVRFLRDKYRNREDTEIVRRDIREVDFDRAARERNREKYKVVGNIPYNLTSSILISVPRWKGCGTAVIMVQREVGERVLTPPGERNCGVLSVFLHAYLDMEKGFRVRAGSFRPRPKVDSEVLKLSPGRNDAPPDRKAFLELIKEGFSQRRKKIKNVLAGTTDEQGRDVLESVSQSIDLGKRAEELKLEEWFQLYRVLKAERVFSDGERRKR